MSATGLLVVAGISLLVCVVSVGAKSWNAFCVALIVLFFSAFGYVMRLIG